MKSRLGVRNWITLILIGLFGQFAWTIENMYFNVFLYNTISTDPGISYPTLEKQILDLQTETK